MLLGLKSNIVLETDSIPSELMKETVHIGKAPLYSEEQSTLSVQKLDSPWHPAAVETT